MLRILLVFPVAYLLLSRSFGWALTLFFAAGMSDALDGFLAKHYHWQSRLGSYLDPLADKLLLVSCFLISGSLGLIPVWLVIVVVLRDLVIICGAFAYYFLHKPFEGRPHWTSKLNTFLQLLLIVAILFHHGIAPLPDGWVPLLLGAVLFSTVLSGIVYVYVWGNSYWTETRSAQADSDDASP